MLRFLLIFLLIFYFIGTIIKWVVKRWFNKLQNQTNNYQNKQKEGKITVNFSNKKKKKINKDEGEYIDYEEIK